MTGSLAKSLSANEGSLVDGLQNKLELFLRTDKNGGGYEAMMVIGSVFDMVAAVLSGKISTNMVICYVVISNYILTQRVISTMDTRH